MKLLQACHNTAQLSPLCFTAPTPFKRRLAGSCWCWWWGLQMITTLQPWWWRWRSEPCRTEEGHCIRWSWYVVEVIMIVSVGLYIMIMIGLSMTMMMTLMKLMLMREVSLKQEESMNWISAAICGYTIHKNKSYWPHPRSSVSQHARYCQSTVTYNDLHTCTMFHNSFHSSKLCFLSIVQTEVLWRCTSIP